MAHAEHADTTHGHGGSSKATIWRTFFILLAITIFEFIIALGIELGGWPIPKGLSTSIYVVMTLLKAFFIIAYFMHLKYEVKFMVWVLAIPFVMFIGWFIIAMLQEGSWWATEWGWAL